MTTPGLRRSDIASSAAWRLKGNFLLLPGSSHGELRARKRPASNRQPWTQTAPWGPCSRREGVNSRFPALSAFPGGHPWHVSRERAAVHSIISVGQQISGEQNAMVTLRRDSSPLWEWSTSSVPRHKKNDLSLVFSDVGNGYAMHPPNRPGMYVQHPAYRRDMHAEYSLRQERAQCRRIRCPAPRNEPSQLRHTDKGTGRHEAAGFAFDEVSADVADAFLLARLFFGLRLRR